MVNMRDPDRPARLIFTDKELHRAAIQPSRFATEPSLVWVQHRRGVFYLNHSDAVALRDYLNTWLEALNKTPGGPTT